ncbi:MAG: putative ABC transporter permease [Erysipelotrichaceae bacterium]
MEELKKSKYSSHFKENKYNNKKIFAQGFCFAKIFAIFFIGCIIGTYYEQILTLVTKGVWESRSGLIYGPFNPIYGFGFAGFIAILGKNLAKRKWYITYFWSCIIGGVAEFSLSLIGEKLFGGTSWDYTGYFLNIGGRTTVPYMLFWGLGGMAILYLVYPLLSKLIEKIPFKIGRVIYPIFLVFMIFNMIISYTALFRQGNREKGQPPMTFIGEFCDKVYTDKFLYNIYPNMTHNK